MILLSANPAAAPIKTLVRPLFDADLRFVALRLRVERLRLRVVVTGTNSTLRFLRLVLLRVVRFLAARLLRLAMLLYD